MDLLIETNWVRLRGRRKAPGRPVTYGSTESFLLHFGLENIADLPGLEELKGAGLFDGRLPPGFGVPSPSDDPELTETEEPLDDDLFSELIEEEEPAQPGAEEGPQPSSEKTAD
jgi:segregation and condensation protein B